MARALAVARRQDSSSKPMGSRSRQKAATRERIICTAYRLFCENGIMSTKTAEVALAAGVSHGSIFVHFPTRDDLVAEVIARYSGEMAKKIHKTVEEGASVREVLQAHLEGIAEHERLYSRLVAEGPVLSSYARATMIGLQSASSFHLAQAVEREAAAGEIKGLEMNLLFNSWIGLVNHYMANSDLFADEGESVVERRGKELLEHFMNMISR